MSVFMDSAEPDIHAIRGRIDSRLAELLPEETLPPQNLSRAIRYATLAPGKRLRGIMTLLAAATGGGAERALDTACAIEMVHAASLIVDDLPMMDDASMRRGQPATHRVFGEDTATLAALALLNRAYGTIAADGALDPQLRVEIAVLLHQAVGTQGLIGGQEMDLHEDYSNGNLGGLSDMYHQKTGLLFIAAAEAGARIAGLGPAEVTGIRRYSRYLGLAYQIADDLADAGDEGRAEQANIVPALGRDRAARLLASLLEHALHGLAPLGPAAEPLAAFARSMFGQATAKLGSAPPQIASA